MIFYFSCKNNINQRYIKSKLYLKKNNTTLNYNSIKTTR